MTIFPKEVIQFSVEHYVHSISKRSQILYSSVLLLLILVLAALPFIFVDVSIQSAGRFRPASENAILIAPVSGWILDVAVSENQSVSEGDYILSIVPEELENQRVLILKNIERDETERRDLLKLQKYFVEQAKISEDEFETDLQKAAYKSLMQHIRNGERKLEYASKIYDRSLALHKKGLLSDKEFDADKYNLDHSRNELFSYQEDYKEQIYEKLRISRERLDENKAKLKVLETKWRDYQVSTPVTGVVQNVGGVSERTYIQAGTQIATISPDDELIAEVYVHPKDIGLVQQSKSVLIQVDSFNYREWGSLSGDIVDISEDIYVSNENSFFKVKCKISRDHLELKNGAKGRLKKGMSFSARFIVRKRSLYHLLFDTVDDWFNPYNS